MEKKNKNLDLLAGEKLFLKRARIALPILVRHAIIEEKIYYSDLAEEIGMPNPRNLNYVLGAIGTALSELSKREKKKIPLINCLAVSKTNQLPGEGIYWFIDKKDFPKLSQKQKTEKFTQFASEVFLFKEWEWVLKELGLQFYKIEFEKKLRPTIIKNKSKFGAGESQEHLNFKNYLASHPQLFGLNPKNKGQIEYDFLSLDAIDVLFTNNSEIIGVEAKSIISDTADILRGLFQCVKYKALIEAEQKVNNSTPNCKVILALEGEFPKELIAIKNILSIEIIDNMKN